MSIPVIILITVAITLAVAIPVTARISVNRKVQEDKAKIGSAEEKARQIIDDALKLSETKRRKRKSSR